MNTYLLLRDNKQSGPYTVPELIEKGIKAYDLVWLDGKSAAWRYPSEIEELKAYAPIVEEQPFDRFYKKSAPEKHFAEVAMSSRNESLGSGVSTQKAANEQQEKSRAQPIEIPILTAAVATFEQAELVPVSASETNSIGGTQPGLTRHATETIQASPEEIKSIFPNEHVNYDVLPPHDGPRKIYVTLPGSKTITRTNPGTIKPASIAAPSDKITERPAAPANDSYRDEQTLYAKSESNQIDRFAPTPRYKNIESEYKKTELADTSFSSKFAGADLLTDTVFPGKSKKSLLAGKQNTAMMVMGALCLLLGGIIIGLAISNSKKESANELNSLVKQIQERERLKQLPASQPVAKTEAPANEVLQNIQPEADQLAVSQKANFVSNPQSKLPVNNPVTKTDKKSEERPVQSIAPEVQPVSVQPAVQENKSLANAAAETTRKNIRQLVSVTSNKYKTGVLGGISDLSLTVSNKSEFEIDQVEVEVAYLGPEKRVVKTQTIVFNNVKAGNQVTLDVPRTNRGVSVTTSIKVINSKSLGLANVGI
jgi:hypothetical protein